MREEDESNIRGGETDMDLYAPVDSQTRYSAKANNSGGPGWIIVDNITGRSVAWIYDQEYGHKRPDEDERRAKQFAAMLNGDQERLSITRFSGCIALVILRGSHEVGNGMKASIKQGKVTHNWRQSPFDSEYWRSDCGMVYSGKLLKPQNGAIRVCLQCSKHREEG